MTWQNRRNTTQSWLLIMCLASGLLLAVVLAVPPLPTAPAFADDPQCDPTQNCSGLWHRKGFDLEGTTVSLGAADIFVNQGNDLAKPVVGTGSVTITGKEGAFAAVAQIDFPGSLTAALMDPTIYREDLATPGNQAEGSQRKIVDRWDGGNGPPACNHTAPQDAIVAVSGSGTVLADGSGNCQNYKLDDGILNPLGNSIVNASAEVQATATVALPFAAGQVSQLKATAATSLQETGALTSPNITVTAAGVVTGSFPFNLAAQNKQFSATPTSSAVSVTSTSTAMDISGQQIKMYGKVYVKAECQNRATQAKASATTTISSIVLSINNTGTFDGCCNGQQPRHGGHGNLFDGFFPEI